MNNLRPVAATRRWTLFGLAIALFGLPAVMLGYRLLVPQTTSAMQLLAREGLIFGLLLVLLWVVRRKEHLPLASIGWQPGRIGRSLLWGLLALAVLGVAVALGLSLLPLLGLSYGGEGGSSSAAARFVPPLLVTLLIMVRAGVVEEVFYRGFAMERLQALTGSRTLAFALPLLLFAASHYRQGAGGVLLALLMGAALGGFYWWKRDLAAVVFAHLMIDLIPNVLIPLLSGSH